MQSESNYFRGAFLSQLRRHIESNPDCNSKTECIHLYQKVYE